MPYRFCLGMNGTLSVKGLNAVFDHLVELSECGEFVTLSPYQLVLAVGCGQARFR